LFVRESTYTNPHTHVWELYCEPTNLKGLSLNFLIYYTILLIICQGLSQ
jgi:ligand-binding SRPBCC domain-containing protein